MLVHDSASASMDVLDLAEAAVAQFAEPHFAEAEGLLNDLRLAVEALKRPDAPAGRAVGVLTDTVEAIETALQPGGISIALRIARLLGQMILDLDFLLNQRDPKAITAVEACIGSLSVAIRKRLFAPSKPVARTLLHHLAALRVNLVASLAEPDPPPQRVAPPQVVLAGEVDDKDEAPRGFFDRLWRR